MSRTDLDILEAMADAELLPAQKPSVIAFNLGLSREHVQRRLSAMIDRGLVEQIEEGTGYYRLTPAGRRKITEE